MYHPPTIVLILILFALLLVIAFSAGTEVAMLSINRYRLRHRVGAGEGPAGLLERLLARPDRWLGANLVIQELASVAASTVAILLAQRSGARLAVPLTMILLAVVMIVFCELTPKIFAAVHAEGVALRAAYVYRVLLWLTSPVVWVTNHIAHGFLRLVGVTRAAEANHALSTDELRTVVTEASALVPQRHRQMLLSILDLERVSVDDIMIPRLEIAAIDVAESWEDILERLRQTPHSRLPLYEGELDNLIGILHMKRIAQELVRGSLTRERLLDSPRRASRISFPKAPPLMQQLAQFQRTRRRLAFVVDRIRRHRGTRDPRGHPGGDRRGIHHRSGGLHAQGRDQDAPETGWSTRARPSATQSLARLAAAHARAAHAQWPAAREARDDPGAGHGAAHRGLRIRDSADRR